METLFGSDEFKTLVKVKSEGNSLNTWCDLPEIKKLPLPLQGQLKSFFEYLVSELGGKK